MSHYAYSIRGRRGYGFGIGPSPTHCATCTAPLPVNPPTGGTGYGRSEFSAVAPVAPVWFEDSQRKLKQGETLERSLAHCYKCCADREKTRMLDTGRATLYLTRETIAGGHVRHFATNWPGELKFRVHTISKGRHNIARTRVDVWFIGPDDKPWHGVNIGDNDILRCRRVQHG